MERSEMDRSEVKCPEGWLQRRPSDDADLHHGHIDALREVHIPCQPHGRLGESLDLYGRFITKGQAFNQNVSLPILPRFGSSSP